MQYYDFTAPASGAAVPLKVKGNYVRYYVATVGESNPTLRIKTDRGHDMLLKPGQGIRLTDTVTSWNLINNDRVSSITGVLVIGEGDVTDNRISGEVSVIDGGKSRSIAGSAFIGDGGAAAVAAQYSHVQLLNPVGSGIRAVIRQFLASASAAGEMEIVRYDTALTLVDNAKSKYVGGAASVCEIRQGNNAALLGAGYPFYGTFAAASVNGVPLVMGEPIVLPPGLGIMLRHRVVNAGLHCTFEFLEESIL